ncbi:MAG: 2-C-methyl-D-erythritol 4-phosphate cytidylyltransferase [Syntrophales bacterium]|nr:2-C-methyl-D-erythritol 4-phosphate cytidylyltransferase [Syntrophales bacterium]
MLAQHMDVQFKSDNIQARPPSLKTLKTVAIIPAGGAGRRLKKNVSKQYVLLHGLPLLVHTLKRFQISDMIHEVFLVVPPDDVDVMWTSVIEKYGLTKIVKVLPGGKERQDSVRSGISAIENDIDIVIIHDAVRPFISQELIRQVVMEAAKSGAVVVAVPVKETVKLCKKGNMVASTPSRNQVWLAQTPQAFQREIIIRAYEAALKDGFYGTDDAGLVERIGLDVKIIPGTYDNIKITTPDDLMLARVLIKKEEWSI